MKYRKLKEIKKLAGNPRIIRDKQFKTLCQSIQDNPKYFEARPCILSNRTGELIIIAGNQRYEAAKFLKLKEVPTFLMEGLTEAKEKEIIIRDNISNGEFDFSILANEWDNLPLADWGVDLPEDWLGGDKTETADAEPQIDRAEELNKTWGVKSGDLWQIGEHRLLCGDSTKKEDVGRVMGGSKSDFLVTSPPYNVGVEYATHDDMQAPWDDYKTFLEQVLDVILPTLKDGRAIAWNIGTLPKTHHVRQHLLLEERYSLTYYRQMVWKKVGVPFPLWYNTKNDPRARRFTPNYQHEVVLIFTKGKLEIGDPTGIDDLCTNDVFEFGQQFATTEIPSGNTRTGAQSNLSRRSCKAHPAAFPVRIPSMFMMHLSAPGEIVIEPFCGSGSTMVACENLHRKCRGIELSENYCAVILQRMTDAFPGIEIKKVK